MGCEPARVGDARGARALSGSAADGRREHHGSVLTCGIPTSGHSVESPGTPVSGQHADHCAGGGQAVTHVRHISLGSQSAPDKCTARDGATQFFSRQARLPRLSGVARWLCAVRDAPTTPTTLLPKVPQPPTRMLLSLRLPTSCRPTASRSVPTEWPFATRRRPRPAASGTSKKIHLTVRCDSRSTAAP